MRPCSTRRMALVLPIISPSGSIIRQIAGSDKGVYGKPGQQLLFCTGGGHLPPGKAGRSHAGDGEDVPGKFALLSMRRVKNAAPYPSKAQTFPDPQCCFMGLQGMVPTGTL